MALFGSKKKTEETPAAKPAKTKAVKAKPVKDAVAVTTNRKTRVMNHDLSGVLKHPRITEKASVLAEKNVYAFDITKDANKYTVAAAVQALYNVTPVKVSIVKNPAKRVFVRGKWGMTDAVKKAYVHLKKGETIEFA